MSNRLEQFYQKYCEVFAGEQLVMGFGKEGARLVLIGEAPGKDEVRLGRPFVGAAGKQLTAFLEGAGLERDQVYITNAIKYRLCKENPKTGNLINRPAKNEEISKNRVYLYEELDILTPEWIVTLGNVPLKALCPDAPGISQVHGQETTVEILGKQYRHFPLYHPASVIYRRHLAEEYEKDMKILKKLLDKPGQPVVL